MLLDSEDSKQKYAKNIFITQVVSALIAPLFRNIIFTTDPNVKSPTPIRNTLTVVNLCSSREA